MKKYLFIKPAQFVVCAVSGAVAALLGLCMGFVDGAFVNLVTDGSMDKLLRVFLLAMLWLLGYLFFTWLYGYATNHYLMRVKSALRQDLFEKIMDQSVPEFGAKNSSTYIVDLCSNIENLTGSYFEQVFQCVYMGANFLGSLVGMLWIDLSNIYIVVVMTLICSVVPMVAKKYVEKRSAQYLGGLDEYTARLKDYLSGFMVIKSFSLHDRIMGKHRACNEDLEHKKMAQGDLEVLLEVVSIFIGIFATTATLGFGVWLVLQNRVRGGDIIAMGHLIGRVTSAFTVYIRISARFQSAKPIIQRFNEILGRESDPKDRGEALGPVEEIAFEDVSFGYTEDKTVLDHVSARFERGRAYAIVGESGCGKTTMFNLLLRYYGDMGGRLTVNGREIGSYSERSYYHQLGWIDPNMFLFEDTIRNNLTLYADVPEEVLQRAVKAARLDALIEELPLGLDTQITENGANLSAGQRQRFALARAMICDPSVYLLDEFTSNLDIQTGTEIESTLLHEKDKLILHITHKLIPELLEQYDEILVMKDGEIWERGSFRELMDKKAYFYSLYTVSK